MGTSTPQSVSILTIQIRELGSSQSLCDTATQQWQLYTDRLEQDILPDIFPVCKHHSHNVLGRTEFHQSRFHGGKLHFQVDRAMCKDLHLEDKNTMSIEQCCHIALFVWRASCRYPFNWHTFQQSDEHALKGSEWRCWKLGYHEKLKANPPPVRKKTMTVHFTTIPCEPI